jgi:hypothetical protein
MSTASSNSFSLARIELRRNLLEDVGRADHLDLAGDALLVEDRTVVLSARIRPREDGFAGLDEQPRLGAIKRRRHPGEHQSEAGDDEGNGDDAAPIFDQARKEPAEIDIDVAGRGVNAGHAAYSAGRIHAP